LSNAGVKVIWFRNPLFNDRGFYAKERPEFGMEWNEIIRVARIVWTDLTVLETEDYWAFQKSDQSITYWVLARYQFSQEMARRYGNPELPHMTKWDKTRITNGELNSYVIWPHAEIGEPMYAELEKRFWELEKKIAYRKP
jgi:hypothetical protein